jgi:hypothetical protein
MFAGAGSPTVDAMHASSMSETGALRIVVALALAVAVTLGIGAALGVVAAITVAVVAVAAGFAFEIHHMQF